MTRTIAEIDADLEKAYEAESEAYWATQNVDDIAEVEAAEAAWDAAANRVNDLEEKRYQAKKKAKEDVDTYHEWDCR